MIVTITLSNESLPGLAGGLERAGLVVRRKPLLHFTEPASWAPLDAALATSRRYGAIAFTSPRAAMSVTGRLGATGLTLGPDRPPVWAVGRSTAAALPPGVRVNLPAKHAAEGLALALVAAGVCGPVLYPCGEERRPEIPAALSAAGIQVEEVVCYAVELADRDTTAEALRETDLIIVASHRVLRSIAEAGSTADRPALICLGESTARTARAVGWEPAGVAVAPTVPRVIEAVVRALAARPCELARPPAREKSEE